MSNVGSAKYVVNFNFGNAFHKDGSPFIDMRIFSNKRKAAQFVRKLEADGFTPL